MQVAGTAYPFSSVFSLGLIGGGVLSSPSLYWFFSLIFDPFLLLTYSLFIVALQLYPEASIITGCTILTIKRFFSFGIPSVIILFIMRRWLLALIPATIFLFGPLVLRNPFFIMIVFSAIMLIARLCQWSWKRKLCSIKRKAKYYQAYYNKEALPAQYTGFIVHWRRFYYCPIPCFNLPACRWKKRSAPVLHIITINCLVAYLAILKLSYPLTTFSC